MRLLTFILCVTATLTNSNLALSGHVNKRSDDRDPLETVVMKLSADLNQMKTQQSVDMNQLHTELAELKGKVDIERRRSSFFAQLSASPYTNPSSGPFRFDLVVFNEGNNYYPNLGTYTAPYSGLYLFSTKLYLSTKQTIHPIISIMINGSGFDTVAFDEQIVTSGYGDNTRSSTFTVRLHAGDKVWVETHANRVYELYGKAGGSFFSGVLISSD